MSLRQSHQSSAPRLEAIFIAPAAGKEMQRVPEVEAIAGRGLRGDRYAAGNGYYSKADPCEVTLIASEDLEIMKCLHGIRVLDGQHRRNLVTQGINPRELAGCQLRIGKVLLEYDRPRPPCGYLERITEPGMARGMGEGAGIGLRILESGTIHDGDAITIISVPGQKRRRRLP